MSRRPLPIQAAVRLVLRRRPPRQGLAALRTPALLVEPTRMVRAAATMSIGGHENQWDDDETAYHEHLRKVTW